MIIQNSKLLKNLKKNISLKDYTTFKIGGKAKYFFEAKTKEDLIEAIKWARKSDLPFFVLGGGSNVLVSDEGFKGLVIKCQMSNVKCQIQNPKFKIICAESGVKLSDLLKVCQKEGLTGLEWASGIPQVTIGGAIRGNAGGFNHTIGEIVKEVEVFDVKTLKIKKLLKNQCKFSYKDSVFKKNKNLIILSCLLILKKGKPKEIEEKIKYVLNYRKVHHPLDLPSAGCVFKNKIIKSSNKKFSKLFKIGKRINNFYQIPAAFLIEKSGLKGKKIGGAEISKKHPNFIVNKGKATSEDVLSLINLVKKRVKEKFQIVLETEIEYLN